ncbi:MAG: aldehyde dehydrogenase family protein, partial [Planctomycetes bacterium]|nr:aldehyde dehydrogenase family protein [Planctomycetota bacterium]
MTAVATLAPPKVADKKMLINGKWVESESGKTFETINPATGDAICRVAEGDKADVDAAVKAARRAFESKAWSRMSAANRGRLLYKLADL